MNRILLVYNPHSSKYCRVKHDILDHPELFDGQNVAHHTIKKAPFETNVTATKSALKDGDLVLAIGGDATAAVCANAILASGKDVTLAVLPYGNFNDLARTLGTMKLADISFDNISKLYPLQIFVDGKFWRYATCYVTIGMTAEAVELFDDPKFRTYMQKGGKSSWRSYLKLAEWYFKHRHKKTFIPEFTLNGHQTKQGISDYCALNGRSMCRVMKGGNDYEKPKVFRSENCRLISFPRLVSLMTKSILYRTPGTPTTRDLLEFANPATVELQAEGEYQVFKDIKTIEVKKGSSPLKVIQHSKRSKKGKSHAK